MAPIKTLIFKAGKRILSLSLSLSLSLFRFARSRNLAAMFGETIALNISARDNAVTRCNYERERSDRLMDSRERGPR